VSRLVLTDVSRRFGTVTAVDRFSLTLQPGEFVSLLGPSGCGKTTTLRMIAGFLEPSEGTIDMDGRRISAPGSTLPPEKRNMSMIFQSYAIWPNMTVAENVAFGLEVRRVPKDELRIKVQRILDVVQMGHLGGRYPQELSGGQQQRVALARALAIRPRVLLLDEPLSALDAKVRVQLRDEIRRVQLEVGTTTLFVTHDQEEALAIADRVGVMNKGRLEQLASPTVVYSRPATPFVAEFVGLTNRLPGAVRDGAVDVRGVRLPLVQPDAKDGPAIALVRPETVSLAADPHADLGPLVGTVVAISFLGALSRVTVDLGDVTVVAQLTTSDASALPMGTRVRVVLRPDAVLIARDEAAAVTA